MIRDAVGAVGEILGATAVVISLVYLVYLVSQIKNQNKAARLSAIHEISVGFREAAARFGTEDISKLVIRANANFDDLADDEAARLVTTCGGFFAPGRKHLLCTMGAVWMDFSSSYRRLVKLPGS